MSEHIKVAKSRFVIIGAGRSGIAAAGFINKEGGSALLCDTKNLEALIADHFGIEAVADMKNVEAVFGRNPSEEEIKSCDGVILSPGVPPDIAPCAYAREHNIPVYSEIEFANSFYRGKIIAVTGTNGKTTTTSLVGELFRNGGCETYVGGNIGDAFINYAKAASPNSFMALEISSFQLSMSVNLHPSVAVITNITPDHLDRHKTMANYIDAKAKVFENMRGDDTLILNYDDETTRALAPRAKCRVLYFSTAERVEGAYLDGDTIVLNVSGSTIPLLLRSELKLLGVHNAANVMCAALSAYVSGVSVESIIETLKSFSPVEHRVEFVAEKHGVKYINDSKGTNPEATMVAINAIEAPIILILGGYDKHSEFDELFKLIRDKVKYCVVLGATAQKILTAAQSCGYEHCIKVENYNQAVEKCASIAQAGDYVLLSPACASWDMFDNYETRGRLFKELVGSLK